MSSGFIGFPDRFFFFNPNIFMVSFWSFLIHFSLRACLYKLIAINLLTWQSKAVNSCVNRR